MVCPAGVAQWRCWCRCSRLPRWRHQRLLPETRASSRSNCRQSSAKWRDEASSSPVTHALVTSAIPSNIDRAHGSPASSSARPPASQAAACSAVCRYGHAVDGRSSPPTGRRMSRSSRTMFRCASRSTLRRSPSSRDIGRKAPGHRLPSPGFRRRQVLGVAGRSVCGPGPHRIGSIAPASTRRRWSTREAIRRAERRLQAHTVFLQTGTLDDVASPADHQAVASASGARIQERSRGVLYGRARGRARPMRAASNGPRFAAPPSPASDSAASVSGCANAVPEKAARGRPIATCVSFSTARSRQAAGCCNTPQRCRSLPW